MGSENSKEELDTFKKDISLVDFLLDKCSCTKDRDYSPYDCRLRDRYDDLLIIYRSEEYHRYNYISKSETGSIVDYVQKYVMKGSNIGQIRKYLRDEVAGINTQLFSSSLPLSAPPPKEIIISDFQLRLQNSMEPFVYEGSFLEYKNISAATVNDPLFIPSIQQNYLDLKETEYTNTVYKITNTAGKEIGFHIRNAGIIGEDGGNKSLKRTYGSKAGFVQSPTPIDVKKIIIFESWEDAMSYKELYPLQDNIDTTKYIATLGQPSYEQINQLKQFALDYPSAIIQIAFDNDPAGIRMGINLKESLNLEKNSAVKYTAKIVGEGNGKSKLGGLSLEGNTENINKIVEQLRNIINLDTTVTAKGIDVLFTNSILHWEKVESVLQASYTNPLERLVPIERMKDFNDSLTLMKNHREYDFEKGTCIQDCAKIDPSITYLASEKFMRYLHNRAIVGMDAKTIQLDNGLRIGISPLKADILQSIKNQLPITTIAYSEVVNKTMLVVDKKDVYAELKMNPTDLANMWVASRVALYGDKAIVKNPSANQSEYQAIFKQILDTRLENKIFNIPKVSNKKSLGM